MVILTKTPKADALSFLLEQGRSLEEIQALVETGMSIAAQAKALIKPDDFSEAGAALVFVERERRNILWTDSAGWFRWDGRKWARDEHGVMLAGMRYSKVLLEDALKEYRDGLTADPNTGKITVPGPIKDYL